MGSLMAGWDSPVLGDDKKGTQKDLSARCLHMLLAENAPLHVAGDALDTPTSYQVLCL